MKKIKAYWEEVVQINCSCVGDDDYIQFHRDKSYHDNIDQEAYYVKFIDNSDWDFKTRLRTFRKYRKDWKEFINGKEQDYNGIYMNYEQFDEFYSTLYNDALTNEIIISEDIKQIENWKPEKEFDKYPWSNKPDEKVSMWLLFKSTDDLVLAVDIFTDKNDMFISDFKFSWAFSSETKKKDIKKYTRKFLFNKNYKYMCQENELFLYKQDLVQLFSVMNYIIKNTSYDGKKYKLSKH